MKQYLVAYDVGKNVTRIKTATVEMEDGYCPADDNMKTLKEKVVKENNPKYVEAYARDDCIRSTDWGDIPADKLRVVAVSNLNV